MGKEPLCSEEKGRRLGNGEGGILNRGSAPACLGVVTNSRSPIDIIDIGRELRASRNLANRQTRQRYTEKSQLANKNKFVDLTDNDTSGI
jgi:hypothetical protein